MSRQDTGSALVEQLENVTIDGDRLRIDFQRFDVAEYNLFLKVKKLPEQQIVFNEATETYSVTAPARFARLLGIQIPEPVNPDLPFSPFLFDDQDFITRAALDAKRYACYSGCGQGKTIIGCEYARHVIHRTGGRVLVVTLNEIVNQWVEEAERFYGESLPLLRLNSRQELIDWCKNGPGHFAITNYEKLNPVGGEETIDEMRLLSGIILDEASRLKSANGKQKRAVVFSTMGIEYKLSLTATPAPNDHLEFNSQAVFLEKVTKNELYGVYFIRDDKTQRWELKPHARDAFFEWMGTWSIYLRNPKKFGWRLNVPDVPPPEYFVHEIEATPEQLRFAAKLQTDDDGSVPLFPSKQINFVDRSRLSQVAKGFYYLKGANAEKANGSRKVKLIPSRKPDFVADLIRQEAAQGLQVLVWTVFDAESDIIADRLGTDVPLALLTGKTKATERLSILERFRHGETRVLISRASVLGFGMNFQHCGSMIFSGFNDSFESMYQAIRRAYRHGQTRRVRVHVPVIPDLEGDMWENLCRKESQDLQAVEDMERQFVKQVDFMRGGMRRGA